MSRVKRGKKRAQKRKRVLKLAKGYFGKKSSSYRIAKLAVDRAHAYAYRDRRQKKRQFRSLWIVRINAAARLNGLSYSRLIAGLKAAGSDLDRKVLADIAVHDPEGFAAIAAIAKEALGTDAGDAAEGKAAKAAPSEAAAEAGESAEA